MSRNLYQIYRSYTQSKMIAIFLWAFACGTPLLLLSSTLSVRLLQAHLNLAQIGLFGFVLLPYSFKCLLAPIVENISPPLLSKYVGRARAWMLYMFLMMTIGILLLAIYPLGSPSSVIRFFLIASSIALSSTINDIAEAEYRIELLEKNELAIGTTCYTVGYGFGEFVASVGCMLIAYHFNWKIAYLCMIFPIVIGMITVYLKKHRDRDGALNKNTLSHDKFRITTIFVAFKNPINDLLQNTKWLLLLIFIYFAPSYLFTMIVNPFYIHQHFTLQQIALLRGIPGGVLMLLGSLLSGYLCQKRGAMQMLSYSAKAYMINALLIIVFCWMATLTFKYTFYLFCFSILLTALIDGIASPPYITLIASKCRIPYTESQNAFLTSLMVLSRSIFASLGGFVAQQWSYVMVFWVAFFLCVSIVALIYRLLKIQTLEQTIKPQAMHDLPNLE